MKLVIARLTSMLLLTCSTSHSISQDAARPHWGEFRDDGCLTQGPSSFNKRVFKSRLWDIPKGADEAAVCTATPAVVNGVPFDRPTLCESTFFGGVWGSFYVVDPSCPVSNGTNAPTR